MMEYLTDEDYEIAEENGIPKVRVYQRVYEGGWSVQKAITEPVKKRTGPWLNYKDVAVVSYNTFCVRIKMGWDPESSALTPPMKPTQTNRTGKAKLTQEHYEAAKANGIGKHTVQSRVYIYKWPVEEAISTPVINDYGDRRKGRKSLSKS